MIDSAGHRVGAGSGGTSALHGLFAPRGHTAGWGPGHVLSSVRGPEPVRLAVLRLAEKAGRVPAGTTDAVRAGASWEQVHELVRQANEGALAGQGERVLHLADETAQLSAAAANGAPGPLLNRSRASMSWFERTQMAGRPPALAVQETLPGDEAIRAGGAVTQPAAIDDLQRAVGEGLDLIARMPEADADAALRAIGWELGHPAAATAPAEELAQLLAQTPAERVVPAMERSFTELARQAVAGAAAAQGDELARAAAQALPHVQEAAPAVAGAVDDAARAAAAVGPSPRRLMLPLGEAIIHALRVLPR